jgi:hypothetical protein
MNLKYICLYLVFNYLNQLLDFINYKIIFEFLQIIYFFVIILNS